MLLFAISLTKWSQGKTLVDREKSGNSQEKRKLKNNGRPESPFQHIITECSMYTKIIIICSLDCQILIFFIFHHRLLVLKLLM